MSNTIQVQFGGSLDLNLHLAPPPSKGKTFVTAQFGAFTVTSEGNHVAYNLPSGNFITVQVSYVDKNNNPAVVDGPVVWSSSDDTKCAVRADDTDSSLAVVAANGSSVGDVQITATADADLGEGVRTLLTFLDITVVAGEAVAGVINVRGESQPIPPTP